MSDAPGSTPPGWFPDPFGRHEHRWFNGTSWTSDVADGGQRFVDPLGIAPGGPGDPPRVSYPEERGRNGLATAAMICGILGALIAWIPMIVVFGIVLGVLALVFGIVGLRRSADAGRGRGFAITGIVTGVLTLALSVVGIALSVVVWNAVSDFMEPGPHEVAVTECLADGRDAVVSGILTNESQTERDYTLFVDVDGRTEVATLDDVPAGETVDWSVEVRARRVLRSCEPDVDVQGPFPFGIEIDAVDS